MAGINKVILVGALGKDPEVRYTQSGDAIANLSLATSESWRDKATGEKKEKTEWHRVVLFGKVAVVAGEYLRKGSQVYIEGKLQTRKWTNQQGQDQYTTEIVVQGFDGKMQMLSGGNGGQQQQQQQGGWGQPQRPQRQQYNEPRYDEPPMDFDDEIPFAPIGLMYSNNLMHCIC